MAPSIVGGTSPSAAPWDKGAREIEIKRKPGNPFMFVGYPGLTPIVVEGIVRLHCHHRKRKALVFDKVDIALRGLNLHTRPNDSTDKSSLKAKENEDASFYRSSVLVGKNSSKKSGKKDSDVAEGETALISSQSSTTIAPDSTSSVESGGDSADSPESGNPSARSSISLTERPRPQTPVEDSTESLTQTNKGLLTPISVPPGQYRDIPFRFVLSDYNPVDRNVDPREDPSLSGRPSEKIWHHGPFRYVLLEARCRVSGVFTRSTFRGWRAIHLRPYSPPLLNHLLASHPVVARRKLRSVDKGYRWKGKNEHVEWDIAIDRCALALGDSFEITWRAVPAHGIQIKHIVLRIIEMMRVETKQLPAQMITVDFPALTLSDVLRWETAEEVNGQFWQRQKATLKIPNFIANSENGPNPTGSWGKSAKNPTLAIRHRASIEIALRNAPSVDLSCPIGIAGVDREALEKLAEENPDLIPFQFDDSAPVAGGGEASARQGGKRQDGENEAVETSNMAVERPQDQQTQQQQRQQPDIDPPNQQIQSDNDATSRLVAAPVSQNSPTRQFRPTSSPPNFEDVVRMSNSAAPVPAYPVNDDPRLRPRIPLRQPHMASVGMSGGTGDAELADAVAVYAEKHRLMMDTFGNQQRLAEPMAPLVQQESESSISATKLSGTMGVVDGVVVESRVPMHEATSSSSAGVPAVDGEKYRLLMDAYQGQTAPSFAGPVAPLVALPLPPHMREENANLATLPPPSLSTQQDGEPSWASGNKHPASSSSMEVDPSLDIVPPYYSSSHDPREEDMLSEQETMARRARRSEKQRAESRGNVSEGIVDAVAVGEGGSDPPPLTDRGVDSTVMNDLMASAGAVDGEKYRLLMDVYQGQTSSSLAGPAVPLVSLPMPLDQHQIREESEANEQPHPPTPSPPSEPSWANSEKGRDLDGGSSSSEDAFIDFVPPYVEPDSELHRPISDSDTERRREYGKRRDYNRPIGSAEAGAGGETTAIADGVLVSNSFQPRRSDGLEEIDPMFTAAGAAAVDGEKYRMLMDVYQGRTSSSLAGPAEPLVQISSSERPHQTEDTQQQTAHAELSWASTEKHREAGMHARQGSDNSFSDVMDLGEDAVPPYSSSHDVPGAVHVDAGVEHVDKGKGGIRAGMGGAGVDRENALSSIVEDSAEIEASALWMKDGERKTFSRSMQASDDAEEEQRSGLPYQPPLATFEEAADVLLIDAVPVDKMDAPSTSHGTRSGVNRDRLGHASPAAEEKQTYTQPELFGMDQIPEDHASSSREIQEAERRLFQRHNSSHHPTTSNQDKCNSLSERVARRLSLRLGLTDPGSDVSLLPVVEVLNLKTGQSSNGSRGSRSNNVSNSKTSVGEEDEQLNNMMVNLMARAHEGRLGRPADPLAPPIPTTAANTTPMSGAAMDAYRLLAAAIESDPSSPSTSSPAVLTSVAGGTTSGYNRNSMGTTAQPTNGISNPVTPGASSPLHTPITPTTPTMTPTSAFSIQSSERVFGVLEAGGLILDTGEVEYLSLTDAVTIPVAPPNGRAT
ncbi:hypothetical protein HK102_006070 [Quaeritorhiza haematococci]|nr:hypothetical protein HK102_006070 [Quaeritorhiza haematococci]